MLRSKKAQIGETMTWIIATIVIIGILLIFTFISSAFAKGNGMIVSLKRVFSSDDLTEVDWIGDKTDLALRENPSQESEIKNWINKIKNE